MDVILSREGRFRAPLVSKNPPDCPVRCTGAIRSVALSAQHALHFRENAPFVYGPALATMRPCQRPAPAMASRPPRRGHIWWARPSVRVMHIPDDAPQPNRHSELAEESPREALGRECGRINWGLKNRDLMAVLFGLRAGPRIASH
jgi:hypothetical protein